MKAERKLVGMSVELHGELQRFSEVVRLPMTLIISTLLEKAQEVDWAPIQENFKRNRLTWPNMRRRIAEYQEKTPGITDAELQALTGFSLIQVETITYTAHKRALAVLVKDPSVSSAQLSKQSKTTLNFAKRIWDQFHGERKITASEQFMWDMASDPSKPTPLEQV